MTKHQLLIKITIVLFCSFFFITEAISADYFYAKVTANVVERTGNAVYGGKVMVQRGSQDQAYSTISTGGNAATPIPFLFQAGDPISVTMKAQADAGYSFSGWYSQSSDDTPVSTNTTYKGWFNTATTEGEDNALSYNMYAKFSPNSYSISFSAGPHGSLSLSSLDYNIESTGTLSVNTPSPDPGYRFKNWKVTSYVNNGNWVYNSSYDASEPLTGKYGSPTLTAQWEAVADITISVSGLASNENAIFTVSNGGGVLYTVALSGGNPSVKIKNLPTGVQYTVQATNGWSWAYSNPTPSSYVFGLNTDGYTASFAYTKDTNARNHDEKSEVNWKL